MGERNNACELIDRLPNRKIHPDKVGMIGNLTKIHGVLRHEEMCRRLPCRHARKCTASNATLVSNSILDDAREMVRTFASKVEDELRKK